MKARRLLPHDERQAVSEAYAVEKDDKMFYAFFTPAIKSACHGTIPSRGLASGKYRVTDSGRDRDLGTVEGENPELATQFGEHLSLEAAAE